jgi:hypothetical protein
MEREAGLLVIKLTDANFLRTLENAIQVSYSPVEVHITQAVLVKAVRGASLSNGCKLRGICSTGYPSTFLSSRKCRKDPTLTLRYLGWLL